MSRAPIIHTAVFEGVSHTLPIRQWSALTKRSTTFITKHLKLAEAAGIDADKCMQYALSKERDYSKAAKIGSEQRALKESDRKSAKEQIIKTRQAMLYKMARC